MTTTVYSRHGNSLTFKIEDSDYVSLIFEVLGSVRARNVPRAEFLAAVAAELDVIVINRADLPEVTVSPDGRIQARGATLLNGTATGSDALGWLAINEYLDAHPPVDEAQVDALAKVIRDQGEYLDETVLARRLVAAGVTAPQAGTR